MVNKKIIVRQGKRHLLANNNMLTWFVSVSFGSVLVCSSFDCEHANAKLEQGMYGKNFASRFTVYFTYSYSKECLPDKSNSFGTQHA